jgi:hypothetical protein
MLMGHLEASIHYSVFYHHQVILNPIFDFVQYPVISIALRGTLQAYFAKKVGLEYLLVLLNVPDIGSIWLGRLSKLTSCIVCPHC